MRNKISVIDLFSGPGGLSEGFAQYNSGKIFGPFVSVEKDSNACETLKIRKLFHYLKRKKHSKLGIYYRYLKSKRNVRWDDIKNEFGDIEEIINQSVWKHELGTIDSKKACKEIKVRLRSLGHKPKKNKIILIGGPPCQAYSVTGRSRRKKMIEKGDYSPEKDTRSFLYEWYLKILPEFKPALFIMENVPGILSSKINGKSIFEKIIKDLEAPATMDGKVVRYKLFSIVKPAQDDLFTESKVIDFRIKSELYGVPQSRSRVIILGIRDDLCKNKKIPYLKEMPIQITAHDVLNGMPLLRSGISKINRIKVDDNVTTWKKELNKNWPQLLKGISVELKQQITEIRKKISKKNYPSGRGRYHVPCLKYGYKKNTDLPKELFSWYIDKKLEGYLNYESRSHMDTDLRRYLFNSIYSNIRGKSPLLSDYPESLLPEHKSKKSGNHKDRFRTVLHDKPGKTITSHISKDGHAYIHYDSLQCRSLTVREAARIQSFPDNYYFCGNRTQQYHQVGNAVPPYLAYQIADIVNKIII